MSTHHSAMQYLHDHPRARSVGHRITLALVCLCTTCLTWFEPASLRNHVIAEAGDVGWAFTAILAFLALVGLTDVVINDLMSDRYKLRVTLEARMYGYMIQAIMNASLAAAILRHGEWGWVASLYIVLAFSSVWVAVVDTYHRYIEPRKKLGTS